MELMISYKVPSVLLFKIAEFSYKCKHEGNVIHLMADIAIIIHKL